MGEVAEVGKRRERRVGERTEEAEERIAGEERAGEKRQRRG